MATVKEAEEMVRRIAMEHGHLRSEFIDNWFSAAYVRELDKTWLSMETPTAHSIKTYVPFLSIQL
jgi:hypothetical protein